MRVIKPVVIGSTQITASNITEPSTGSVAEAEWVSGASYAKDQIVIRASLHKRYVRIVAGAGTTAPESDATNWYELGPTNKYAMFDAGINTKSTNANTITMTIAPGEMVTEMVFCELVGSSLSIIVKDHPGGTIVKQETKNLDGSNVADWYDYFFGGFAQLSVAIFRDIPAYSNPEITFTLTGPGDVSCGMLILGQSFEIGSVKYGASAGMIDYSSKSTNQTYGVTKLERREFAKRNNYGVIIDKIATNKVFTLVTSLRGTVCAWIGSDDYAYSVPMVTAGFVREFMLEIAYPSHSLYTIQLEDMLVEA